MRAKRKKTWLWIIGWLLVFPLPLTILLLRKKEMKPLFKYSILVIAWIVYLVFIFSGKKTSTENADVETIPAVAEASASTNTAEPIATTEPTPTFTPEPTPPHTPTPNPTATPDPTPEPTPTSVPTATPTPTPSPTPFVPQMINVDIKVESKRNSETGGIIINIWTNLPENTVLMITVKDGYSYTGQDKVTIQKDGTASSSEFSFRGEPLKGKHTVSISMSLPRLQAQSVQDIIGSKGEYITGKYVEKDDITNSNWVDAEFTMDF